MSHTKAVKQQQKPGKTSAAKAETFTGRTPSPVISSTLGYKFSTLMLCTSKLVQWYHLWRRPLQRASVIESQLWSVFDVLGSSDHESCYKDFCTLGSSCNISAYSTITGFLKRQFPSFIFTPTKYMWSHVTHFYCKGENGLIFSPGFEEALLSVHAVSAWLPGYSSPWLLFWLKGNLEIFFLICHLEILSSLPYTDLSSGRLSIAI